MKANSLFLSLLIFAFSAEAKDCPRCFKNFEKHIDNSYRKSIFIEVRYLGIKMPDSLTIQFCKHAFNDYSQSYLDISNSIQISRAKNKSGLYRFEIKNVENTGYISLMDNKDIDANGLLKPFLNLYFAELGDSIRINISYDPGQFAAAKDYSSNVSPYLANGFFKYLGYKISFIGKNSVKYSARYEADMNLALSPAMSCRATDSTYVLFNCIRANYDSLQKRYLAVLNKYRSKMSPTAYEIMRLDITGMAESKFIDDVIFSDKNLARYLIQYYDTYVFDTTRLSCLSKSYVKFIFDKENLRQQFDKGNYNGLYELIKDKYKGELRDKLLTYYVFNWYFRSSSSDSLVTDALRMLSMPYCVSILKSLGVLSKGQPAFDFTLSDIKGKKIKLHQFKGKVVFIDFWFTGCTACAGFYKEQLSSVEVRFKSDTNVVFITISIDVNKKTWIQSVKSGNYTSPDIVNLYTEGLGFNHPVAKFYRLVGCPQPILIDKSGNIYETSKVLQNENELLKSIEQILKSS